MRSIVLIAHNLRSTHNVGSLLRTADGLGVARVYFTGYTPYPKGSQEDRLPHISRKLDKQINKTALGAEKSVQWQHVEDIHKLITSLQDENYQIVALEQANSAIKLTAYKPSEKVALIVGREVEGIEPEVLGLCDKFVEIPMVGAKESFNVVQAAAIGLYHIQYYPFESPK